ncbi:hypothetical protein BELL_0353g00030 [Botrytis elliptica]|uniref:Uncharacterized protein n=1 Tax=Botrytis elliptica TaxID=278938 RepID=A0A4Z1JIH6_9HELO|nr:hypothetical protein BELL_0353g00030 [Botrytis elliptica]
MSSKTDQAKADSRTQVQGGERAPTQEHGEVEVKKEEKKVGEGRSMIRDIGSRGSGGKNRHKNMVDKDRAKSLRANIYEDRNHLDKKYEKNLGGEQKR